MRTQRGFTLVELLIGSALLVGGGGALLLGICSATIHATYLQGFQVSLNAAQGQLEQLMATPFDQLWANAQANPNGQCRGMGEDVNCNGLLDGGEDADGDGVLDTPLPGGRLAMQIRQPVEDQARNPGNPMLLDVHVAACWTSRGRSIGEDKNCNGMLDAGEDANGNGWIDSPVMMSTRVARRD